MKDFRELTRLFEQLTGQKVGANLHTDYMWAEWFAFNDPPWTEAELRVVVDFVKVNLEAKGGPYKLPWSLSFKSCIGDCARFADLLSMAQARKPPKPTSRDQVLEQSGRPQVPPDPTVSAAQALERTKLSKMLGEWKQKNL